MSLSPKQQQDHQQALDLLNVLANPIRFQIIWLLDWHGPLTASLLAYHLRIELNQLQPYLDSMHSMGMLLSRWEADQLYYALMDPSLGKIVRLALNQ